MRVHLSPHNLDDYLIVPPGKKRIEIADLSGPPGFFLETRATGVGTYWCRYRRKADGRMMYSKIGRTTEIGLIAARKRALQIRGQVAGGEDPRGDELAKRNTITYETYVAEDFFPHCKPSSLMQNALWNDLCVK